MYKDDEGSDQSINISHYLNISMYCLLPIFYENILDQPCRFLALAAVVIAHLTKCIIIENNVVNKKFNLRANNCIATKAATIPLSL